MMHLRMFIIVLLFSLCNCGGDTDAEIAPSGEKQLSARAFHSELSKINQQVASVIRMYFKSYHSGNYKSLPSRYEKATDRFDELAIKFEKLKVPRHAYAEDLYNEHNFLLNFYESIIYDDFGSLADILNDEDEPLHQRKTDAEELIDSIVAAEEGAIQPVIEAEELYADEHKITLVDPDVYKYY